MGRKIRCIKTNVKGTEKCRYRFIFYCNAIPASFQQNKTAKLNNRVRKKKGFTAIFESFSQ